MLTTLFDRLKSWPLYLLPHHLCSRLIFRLTRVESRMVPGAIRIFCKVFDVDLNEAAQSQATDYPTFNAFFTRELKAGARPLHNSGKALVSPVDGRVSESGQIRDGQLLQAKGKSYTVSDLLGGRDGDVASFNGGQFATLYLSPRDYHRIHMPIEGVLCAMHYLPGRLFSVAPHTVRVVPRLFARNERVVCLFDTPAGKMAMVLVGAINVAAIETVWAGLITPPNGSAPRFQDYSDGPTLQCGEEMGRFNMGSTVILLLEKGSAWNGQLSAGNPVRMGQAIGELQ